MNIHDRIQARCDNMTEDTPGVVPKVEPEDLFVGKERNGSLHFYKHGGLAKNSYQVQKFPAHRERLVYTLSQMLQSQQKAMKLVSFVEEMEEPGTYCALGILNDCPERLVVR